MNNTKRNSIKYASTLNTSWALLAHHNHSVEKYDREGNILAQIVLAGINFRILNSKLKTTQS